MSSADETARPAAGIPSRSSGGGVLAAATLALTIAIPLDADGFLGPGMIQRSLHAASAVVGSGCSGVLTRDRDLVFTAAHCVRGSRRVTVEFSTGARRTGTVVGIDRVADQALLRLDAPVAIEPLALARDVPAAQMRLYFEGNPADPAFQRARLNRIGVCPSLPDLPNALFTTIEGEPGDSGAPLVDRAGRVVGLVHGGSRCHIVTPANRLRALLRRLFEWDDPGAATT